MFQFSSKSVNYMSMIKIRRILAIVSKFIYISYCLLNTFWPAFSKRQVRVNWCKYCNWQCFAQRARFCVLNVGNLVLSHLLFQRILKSSQFLAGILRFQHFVNPSFPESIIFCNLLYSSILIMHRVVRALRVVSVIIPQCVRGHSVVEYFTIAFSPTQ